MLIASKEEMFKRAYTGLQNICRQKKIGSIHNINSTEFSYPNGNKTSPAILFVISPSKYYIFAFDDGLIIEYIDNKINVLDFNHINKEYDVNSNQEIIDTLYKIGRSVISHSTAYFAQTFFKKKLNKTHNKYLSDNDKNTINEFLHHYNSPLDHKSYILYQRVSEILFLKSGRLLIDSSQLELDMTELDEYYVITFSRINESKIFTDREYSKATTHIYEIVNRNIANFNNGFDCRFTMNDEIELSIGFNIAKVKRSCPFFIPTLGQYLDRYIDSTRVFCIDKRENLNWIQAASDYARYMRNYDIFVSDLESFTNYLFLSPTAIDQLNISQLDINARSGYIVFGRASANKLSEKINENERAKLFDVSNELNINIPTEDEFLNSMHKLYKELKKSSKIQSNFYQEFDSDFKSRFKDHFEQDKEIEVI